MIIDTILALAGGVFLGSLPFGFWLARIKGVDIRKKGSGNIGATNVGRILGREWGYLVFALDAFKGWLAIWGASFAIKRIVSISSLLAATAFPFLVMFFEPGRRALLLASFALAGLVWYRHRDNLQRLMAGTEDGFQKTKPKKKKKS